MEKEKITRKRSSDPRDTLPAPPPNPQQQQKSGTQILPEAFRRLLDYKDRETVFLKNLNEAITSDCKKIKCEPTSDHTRTVQNSSSASEIGESINKVQQEKSDCEMLREECEGYIMPLLSRTGPSISAALVAHDAFEQLNRLHGLLDQMLSIQEQNYQMRRHLRDVRTLCELKKLQKKEAELPNEGEVSDAELDLDNHASLLSTILAAGNSASTKRSSSKRQRERSKSVIADDIQMYLEKENKSTPTQMRRQSAFSESKAKVSKWTKVKAAFKWERANVPILNEGKSSDSGIGLTPINHEVARYLRVPSVPCAGSSADSVLSSSSGHLLSCGSVPATPGTISSASSIEDVGPTSEELREHRDSSKSDSRCYSRVNEDETRRSRSLDGDSVIGPTGQSKSKTPWRKVKDIIQTHRGSFKGKTRSRSVKSTGSITGSRDASPCESLDTASNFEDRNDGSSSTQTSAMPKNLTSSSQGQESCSFGSSPTGFSPGREEMELKLSKSSSKGSRKSRILSDFESLPEDVIVDLKTNYSKPPPSPLNLTPRQDSSDAEIVDFSYSPTIFHKGSSKSLKPKKFWTPGNSSVPSSPSRHSEFFGEFESEDLSSGDFSEPSTPHRKLSPKSSLQVQQEEINEKYFELREKLTQEFEMKRQEWEKIRAACSASTSCAYTILSKDEPIQSNKSVPTKLLEENLSADFKKKLHKWRVRKQSSGSNIHKDPQISPTKESEQKKIDWNLWKTGQFKLEGQGLTPLPDQKDLPEDFQKKLEQWKKMKESNTVPPYNSQDSLKRSGKSGHSSKSDSSKKSKEDIDREKQRPERDKVKSHEKDKLEKLSKLKAIVTDSPAKEIEVQTSIGVMKFEGISRKFTRKLYEWEKARGIGPESSTFALLHPGYRPLDVGNASHEMKTHESSPTLGRSLSLDSISPNPSVPSISHQPSSLSLSNMDELKDSNGVNDRKVSSNPELDAKDHNVDEPEAVIVEVEDDIIETAAPLLAAMPIVEQQTPVYKYEVPCSDFCNAGKHDTVLQRDAKVNRLSNQTLENVNYLKLCLHGQESFKKNIQHCQSVLASLKETLPELEKCTKEGSQTAQDALDLVKKLVSDLLGLLDTLKDDEACCKEMISEKTSAIDSKLKSLDKSINLVCKYLDMQKQQAGEHIPKINITSDDGVDKSVAIVSTTPTVFQTQVVINQPRVLIGTATTNNNTQNSINDRPDPPEAEIPDITAKKLNRNASNGSKKKLRLRKMGSRQNSKTESDSSDEDNQNVILENPRRLKRKTSRAKKNPDDELKKNDDKKEDGYVGDDIVYVLKIKPGQMIKQSEITREPSDSKVLISPTETCIQLMGAPLQENHSNSTSIFIKTKRKIFTTVEEGSGESKAVIARDIESSSASERNDKENEFDKSKAVVTSLPPIPQSPNSQKRVEQKITPPKEPSPSIRFMIAKYNQKLAMERSSRSPGSSGSCSPVTLRSPVLDHRVRDQRTKYQEQVELVVKSASAGNIRQNDASAKVSCSPKETSSGDNKISKSCSADALPSNWKCPPGNAKDSSEYECKPPLACDSLKILHKHSGAIPKCVNPEPPKKEHLYRKNKDKPTSLFTKSSGSTVKKIGTKSGKAEFIWRRSISSSNAEMWPIQPDKSDNTVPKITRKLDSNKSSPEEKKHFPFDLPCHPSVSAPTTPSEDCGRPKTPISERALKLQKAKEEFLRGYVVHPSLHRDEPKDDMWKKRLSAVSVGSDTSNEDCALSKSASVGVINSSDTDCHNMAGYVSLPRAVARSGKITSKFGFSSLASKFRKVKMRRGSKDQTKMNAVSALCRQSLAIDIMPEEINASGGEGQLTSSTRNLAKSGSSQAIGFSTFFKKNDKLNKSKSTNTVPNEDSLKK